MEIKPKIKWWWKEGTTDNEKKSSKEGIKENESSKKFIDTPDIFREIEPEEYKHFKSEAGLIDTREIEEKLDLNPDSIYNLISDKEDEIREAKIRAIEQKKIYDDLSHIVDLKQLTLDEIDKLPPEDRELLAAKHSSHIQPSEENKAIAYNKYQQKLNEVAKLKVELKNLKDKIIQS